MTSLSSPYDSPEEYARLQNLGELRNKLQVARLEGVKSVRDSDGSLVEYRSDAEMAAAIAAADAEIAAFVRPQPKTIYLRTSKGL